MSEEERHDEQTEQTPQVAELQAKLDEANRTIDHLERRAKIDALLAESDTIDADTVRLLTERAVMEMDEPDVAAAVEDLKRHKPHLFRRRPRFTGSTMAARVPDEEAAEPASHAARQATVSGDRRDLLRYLRMRRKG